MKSNAPWSVKGIERDARETAKEAAKREGMTVGEWLNQMIYTAGDPQSSDGNIEGLQLGDIVTAIEHLNKRVADSSAAANEAVTDTTRTLGDVVERVQRLERSSGSTGDRERVDALKALEKAVTQVAVQFNNSQKATLDRLDSTESQVQKLAGRIDEAGGAEATGVGFLKDAVEGLQTRLSRTERSMSEAARAGGGASADPSFVANTDNRLRVLGDEIKRGGDQIGALEGVIGKLAKQIDAAERRSAEGVQKTAETLADLREKFSNGQFDGPNREDIAAVVTDQTRDIVDRVDHLQSSFEQMITQLERLDSGAQPLAAVSLESDPDIDAGTDVDADLDTSEEIDALTADDFIAEAEQPVATQPVDDEAETIAHSDDELELLLEETADLSESQDDHTASLESNNDSELALEDTAIAPTDEDEIAASTDDDDDDFFSFADDIDATLEETSAEDGSEDGDDGFSFELEDDDASALDTDDEGAALLSEIQGAFDGTGEVKPKADAKPTSLSDEREALQETDLDELLAGIDQPSETETHEETAPLPQAASVGQTTKPAAEDSAQTSDDYMKVVRRKAREDAQERENTATKKPKRRNLTPKQKAILAARARKKRLAEQAGENGTDDDPAKRAAAKSALSSKEAPNDLGEKTTQHVEDDDEKRSGIGGIISGLTSSLPFIGGKKKDDDDTSSVKPASDTPEGTDLGGDEAALENLRSTTSARPVTLALGIGIFLALGVLFFMIKDLVFPPQNDEANGRVSTIEQPAQTAPDAAPTSTQTPTLEVPSAPAIDPVTLYRDAMTGLSAAQTASESEIAIGKLREAALLGHPPAQLQLGELYKTGQGVDQDPAQARIWFQRSANGGNLLSMHRLGVMTARGEGGPVNTPVAITWFEQAANHGLLDSMYNLGALYHPSPDPAPGSLQDAGKAYFWYTLAAQNGDDAAQPLAAGIGATLTTDQRASLDQTIATWEALPSDAEANALAVTG